MKEAGDDSLLDRICLTLVRLGVLSEDVQGRPFTELPYGLGRQGRQRQAAFIDHRYLQLHDRLPRPGPVELRGDLAPQLKHPPFVHQGPGGSADLLVAWQRLTGHL